MIQESVGDLLVPCVSFVFFFLFFPFFKKFGWFFSLLFPKHNFGFGLICNGYLLVLVAATC